MNSFLCRYVIGPVFFMLCLLQLSPPVHAESRAASQDTAVRAGAYVLRCGEYVGYETDYDHAAQKTVEKEIRLLLTQDEIIINGIAKRFTVREGKLYFGEQVMYEAIGDDKMLLLAGGGVIFEHE